MDRIDIKCGQAFSDISIDFKIYHLAIVDQLDDDQEAELEQRVLDDHELKVMELIDRIGESIGKPPRLKLVQRLTLWLPTECSCSKISQWRSHLSGQSSFGRTTFYKAIIISSRNT